MAIGTLDPPVLAQLAVVTFFASVVQGLVGFGFTLLAVGFFLVIIGSGDAVSLLIIINLTISLALVGKLWRDVDRALWSRLMLGALVGLPIGLLAFTRADVDQLQIGAAVVIVRHTGLGPRRVARIRRRGLPVWTYTVNDPRRVRALTGMGVTGIVTDAPRTVAAAL